MPQKRASPPVTALLMVQLQNAAAQAEVRFEGQQFLALPRLQGAIPLRAVPFAATVQKDLLVQPFFLPTMMVISVS